MSPVVQVVHNKAGEQVAFADTLVGTDSHTPMVDALGVISIGVGGLEAESVMLGNPSYMRLPDYVGVKLIDLGRMVKANSIMLLVFLVSKTYANVRITLLL